MRNPILHKRVLAQLITLSPMSFVRITQYESIEAAKALLFNKTQKWPSVKRTASCL